MRKLSKYEKEMCIRDRSSKVSVAIHRGLRNMRRWGPGSVIGGLCAIDAFTRFQTAVLPCCTS